MGPVKWAWVVVAVLAAVLVRLPASTTLAMDEDEPIYLSASMEAAKAIRDRDWSRLVTPRLNPEHPGLVKTLNGVVLSRYQDPPDLVTGLATVRGLSVLAGLGAVAIAAAVHPLAGLALAPRAALAPPAVACGEAAPPAPTVAVSVSETSF